ncbi:hypothetical protein LOK49_LG06G00365 [Camellia lanceoleosa]|uniref:Uncharacterized protein n=1 Tax=Camellia lanceoleosa TaxID=1840588 RepID=A0ACC0HA83_9ERIC|nr:hypothetical protein LOK49_LG06G00365 [Camellia lanceoleosa]
MVVHHLAPLGVFAHRYHDHVTVPDRHLCASVDRWEAIVIHTNWIFIFNVIELERRTALYEQPISWNPITGLQDHNFTNRDLGSRNFLQIPVSNDIDHRQVIFGDRQHTQTSSFFVELDKETNKHKKEHHGSITPSRLDPILEHAECN